MKGGWGRAQREPKSDSPGTDSASRQIGILREWMNITLKKI